MLTGFSIEITSLREERANLSAFRTFVQFALVWFCLFPLPLPVWVGLRPMIVALAGLFSYPFFMHINNKKDSIVLDLAKAIDVELKIEDIDRSHRLGKPGSEASPRSKPRDIIVKFATYRMRQKVYKSRTLTKERNYRRVFINEDLTILRSQLLYEARRRVKSKQLKSAWSSDGTILVKHIDDNGTVSRVTCESDLPAYVPLPNEPGTRSTR